MENTTEWTSKKTAFSKNKNKTNLTSLSKEAKRELTDPSLPPREARGSTSFPTAGKELAKPREKSLAKLADPSEKSLDKEAKKGDENNKEKTKAKLTVPSLEPTKARGSTRGFLHKSSGATSAGRQGTQPKLAGETPAPSPKSTNLIIATIFLAPML